MGIILNIETATKNCSVSLSEEDKILTLVELNEGQFSHAEKLHTFILEVLKTAHKSMSDIDAVSVSKGPGSYTGLRIGVSAVKGLCFSLELPLISIPTLTSMATSIQVDRGDLIVSMLDARRMEVYAAVFDSKYQQIDETKAVIIDENSFNYFLHKGKVYFIGDGAAKCKDILAHKNAVFMETIFPSAKEMGRLAYEKYLRKDFEDLAYFEPYYLKDFVAGKPKKVFN